jgi:hypothetical protein
MRDWFVRDRVQMVAINLLKVVVDTHDVAIEVLRHAASVRCVAVR